MLEHADRAEREGRLFDAAFYLRAAEFFMTVDHPQKLRGYDRFIELFDREVDKVASQRTRIPFGESSLPAIVIPTHSDEKDVILLHGGFDSLMEELYDWGIALAEAGYRVVLFEGPGQGAALRRNHLVMTPDWERPVAALLDHFGIEHVLDDFFNCFAARSPGTARVLEWLSKWGLRRLSNAVMRAATRRGPDLATVIAHGMHVSGAKDPFEFIAWLRSITGRIFTRQEHAGNHCQIGNAGLALDAIVRWLDSSTKADPG